MEELYNWDCNLIDMNQNNLFLHQIDFLKENPNKKMLVWETGSGKSLTAIKWAIQNTDMPTLVITPKALKENWSREIKKWCSGIRSRKQWKIISKEEFRRDWEIIDNFNCIIIDEFHYFSGMKSQMSKSLGKYISKYDPQYVLGLSATPFMSNPWSVYRLSNLLGYHLDWYAFKNTFFYDIRMGRRIVPVMKKGIEKDVAKLVQRMGNVVKLSDCVDVPDAVFEVETLELTKEQIKAIKEVDDILPIVRYTKYHQICGGTLKGNEYEKAQTFKCDKLDRLLEITLEAKKLIVVSRYNEEASRISEFLTENGIKSLEINGSVKNRDAIIQDFNKSDEVVLIVQAACSEGWEAPTCDTMVFYSYDYSLKNYIQMMGRIQRINNIQKCKYISLIVADSIDEEIYKTIQRKEDFHIELYKK